LKIVEKRRKRGKEKMTFAKKFNRSTPRYKVRINHPAYTSLADLYRENGQDHVYCICAVFINEKGRFGPQGAVAIDENTIVNLPPHLLEACQEMRADNEATEAINNGQAGFSIYTYESKSGRLCYSVNWVDLTD
jgi:hypothetical protein